MANRSTRKWPALALAMVLSSGCTATRLDMTDGLDASALVEPAEGTSAGGGLEAYLAAAVPGEVQRSFIGARMGLLAPAAARDVDYSASFTLGVFYPGRLPGIFGLDSIPFEAGLDLAWISSEDGAVDASLFLIRFDCLFSKWMAATPTPDFYVLGGFQIIADAADMPGEDKGEVVSGLDLGVGLAWPEKGWDARLTYSILMGSKNIGGLLLVTGGYSF